MSEAIQAAHRCREAPMLTGAEKDLLRLLAQGDTLHGDDPRMSVLLDLEARGLGQVRYHFGWYFDATDPDVRLLVET